MATQIVINATIQRPGNAAESLVVHADIVEEFRLEKVISKIQFVEFRADEKGLWNLCGAKIFASPGRFCDRVFDYHVS